MQLVRLIIPILCIFVGGFSKEIEWRPTKRTFVITATRIQQIQLALIVRLGNTLNLVKNLDWIIVSGSDLRPEIKRYLDRLKINHTILLGE